MLITGASGLLGRHLAPRATSAGWSVVGTFHSAPREIAGVAMHAMALPGGARARIAAERPDVVVHTAYTQHPSASWRVVVDGTGEVARACGEVGARLIHLSSDLVFGGREAPYTEDDVPAPISPYGAAKAAAEALVAALCPDALAIRTSLLYTAPGALPEDPGRAFVRALCADPARGALFVDEVRAPLCVADLADAIVELASGTDRGVLHIAGPSALSRYEFGALLARSMGLDASALPRASAQGTGRPGRVVLANTRVQRVVKAPLRGVQAVLGLK